MIISIIISSYQPNYFLALEKNIAETIGIPYEIIKIDNPNTMGICEAYNKGASKAQFENLLFIHEDILFQTKYWGELLINYLNKKNTGVVGLAGSKYVPSAPASWSISNDRYTYCNVNSKKTAHEKLKSYQKVFALDGVFLAVKKSVYQEFTFDENIEGFHGYDTDFSLRVATQYHNYVIGNIFIEHFSKGILDKKWIDNNIQIRKKIKYNFNDIYDEDLELRVFYSFLKKYFQYYRFNLVNLRKTLFFLPSKISLKNICLIFNEYIHYAFRRKID